MFTGIVTALGTVSAVREGEGAYRLRIDAPAGFLDGVSIGDSIAVDGACLTPVRLDGDAFEVDAVLSTLERTLAGGYRPGTRVNLEKAMALGARLDGHLVQGHVDGRGRLVRFEERGETRFLTFEVPAEVWTATIVHGSITLNGVSLTVNDLSAPDRLQVAIIPHTWEHTNLGLLSTGDAVNVEGDLLGKYVGRILASRFGGGPEGASSPPVQ
ncbi:riboflavin synthase [Gaopeijia maritima]|uniref:Riboflavin synthase n=1 Tax=Gaopeijia maritima TaxID=3119007 RepID=A0ABU9E8Y5_9BACT